MNLEMSYEIVMKEAMWTFNVIAESEDEAMDKLKAYLEKLFVEDGFSHRVSKAQEAIKSRNYSIAMYDGVIVK